MRLSQIAACAIVFACASACGSKGHDPKRSNPMPTPTRSGDSTTTVGTVNAGEQGQPLLLNGSVTTNAYLVLSLETLPNPQTLALSDCLPPFAADTPIGEVRCADDATRKLVATITAGQTMQECLADPDYSPKLASVGLTLQGCERYDISVYNFQPSVHLMLVSGK